MNDEEVKFCSNCKREVPAGNFVMHHVHCQRKLALCQKCDEPIPHSELASHNINYHAIIPCPACGSQMEKRNLSDHQARSCSRRAICCAFCHLESEAGELAEHENYCGSRTERCEECREFVMLKYQQLHEDTNHGFLKLDDEPGPAPSWSAARPSASNLLNDLSRRRKVSNASQDQARPTAAANRLSPSKRTNDMPQLNSTVTASKPKALHKTAIHTEEESVDLDRLLALRLAEQERCVPDLSPRDSGGELVALPCEFCDAMVPANQLVLHETGCRPDLAVYLPRVRQESEPVEDGLPCEFCGALFPPRLLLQHEATCDVTSPSESGVLVNQLGPTRPSTRGAKKRLNLGPTPPVLFPIPRRQPSPTGGSESEDRNPYLMEVRAALNKAPTSSLARGRHRNTTAEFASHNDFGGVNHQMNLPASCVNGYVRRNGSTGAVPKQKAGKRVGIREVSQEVPRPSAPSVVPSLRRAGNPDASR